jgi:hypothetical protein
VLISLFHAVDEPLRKNLSAKLKMIFTGFQLIFLQLIENKKNLSCDSSANVFTSECNYNLEFQFPKQTKYVKLAYCLKVGL